MNRSTSTISGKAWRSLWATPAGILLLLCFYVPLGGLIWLSFGEEHFTLAKYAAFLTQYSNLRITLWTILLATIVTTICLLISYPVAYVIRKHSGMLSSLVLIAVLIPYFTSYLVRTYAWMVLLGRFGPLNKLALELGLTDEPFKILYTSSSVIVCMVYILIPYCTLIILTVMRSIPDNLTRAACTLGAPRTQVFFRVFLPLSAPGIAAAALLTFVFALGFYITPALLGGPGDMTVPMLIDVAVNVTLDWSAAAAISVIVLLATLSIYTVANRFARLEDVLSPRGMATSRPSQGMHGPGRAYIWILDFLTRIACRFRFGRTGSRLASTRPTGWSVLSLTLAAMVFLLSPLLIIVPISFSSSNFLEFPPPGFSLRWYDAYFSDSGWLRATYQTLVVGLWSALLSVGVGTGAALCISRASPVTRNLAFPLILAPLIIPSIVGSVALYFLFSYFQIVGTTLGLVLAHSIGSIPIVTLVVTASLQSFNIQYERAAASLGASPPVTLWRVTLPLIKPALIVSTLLAFLHSSDEVVYALFLSDPRTITLPVRMWSGIRDEITPTIAAVSTILVIATLFLYGFIGWLRHQQQARNA